MKFNKEVLDVFQHISLFEALEESQLEKMLAASRKITLSEKSILFEKGAPAEFFYLLYSGQIKLFILSAEGDEKVMEIIYPSHTFAEAILFMPKQFYPVSAEAIDDSELYP
ncbi:MAG: Crp/Fnr family transcriptional regulator [Gammaproteobacteria bacterium]